MRRINFADLRAGLAFTLTAAALVTTAQAQTAAPPYATTKVEGTDNVYIFRYAGHQSMFIVTKAGVIVTDPIGLRRPAASHSRTWARLSSPIKTPRRESPSSSRPTS